MTQLLTLSLKISPNMSEEAHFYHLYIQSYCFSHYLQLMAIGEGNNAVWPVNYQLNFHAKLSLHHNRQLHLYYNTHPSGFFGLIVILSVSFSQYYNRCCTSLSLNLLLHWSFTHEQYAEIHKRLHLGQQVPNSALSWLRFMASDLEV